MDRTMEHKRRNRYEQQAARVLMAVAVVVLFCGLFAQIAVRAQVSAQNKEIAAVRARISAMNADVENVKLCINQHHNLDEIGKRASALGMEKLTEDRLRHVNLPAVGENTFTQTVANTGGEEISG